MAVIYVGNNNQAKKVKKFYIGINNQAKKIKRGYIGINGQAKLFYRSEIVGYFKQQVNNIYNLTFNTDQGYNHIINTDNSDGYIWTDSTSGYIKNINTECNYIYLYSNATSFFYFYASSTMKPVNIEQLGFDYVTNLTDFQSGGQQDDRSFLYGNIAKIRCDNVINASNAFWNCRNITGNPCSMPNAVLMNNTFIMCTKLKGNPICGSKVTDLRRTYEECQNLTGTPVCGPNVTSMYRTYYNCKKLTGELVCGPKVTTIENAYNGCINCTYASNFHFYGSTAYSAFWNINTWGNFYFHNIKSWGSANYCFMNRMELYSSWNRLNIFVPSSMSSADTGYRYWFSLGGSNITWTTITNGSRNTLYNIYIYNNL